MTPVRRSFTPALLLLASSMVLHASTAEQDLDRALERRKNAPNIAITFEQVGKVHYTTTSSTPPAKLPLLLHSKGRAAHSAPRLRRFQLIWEPQATAWFKGDNTESVQKNVTYYFDGKVAGEIQDKEKVLTLFNGWQQGNAVHNSGAGMSFLYLDLQRMSDVLESAEDSRALLSKPGVSLTRFPADPRLLQLAFVDRQTESVVFDPDTMIIISRALEFGNAVHKWSSSGVITGGEVHLPREVTFTIESRGEVSHHQTTTLTHLKVLPRNFNFKVATPKGTLVYDKRPILVKLFTMLRWIFFAFVVFTVVRLLVRRFIKPRKPRRNLRFDEVSARSSAIIQQPAPRIMNPDAKILNAALDLVMDWGETLGKPIRERLIALYPSLSPAEADGYDTLARELQSFAFEQVELCYTKQMADSELRPVVYGRYPMLGEEQFLRLQSQGRYYAWRENG